MSRWVLSLQEGACTEDKKDGGESLSQRTHRDQESHIRWAGAGFCEEVFIGMDRYNNV